MVQNSIKQMPLSAFFVIKKEEGDSTTSPSTASAAVIDCTTDASVAVSTSQSIASAAIIDCIICKSILPDYQLESLSTALTTYCILAAIDTKSSYKFGYASGRKFAQVFATNCNGTKASFQGNKSRAIWRCDDCKTIRYVYQIINACVSHTT